MLLVLKVLFIALGISVILNMAWHAAHALEQQQRPRFNRTSISGFLRETAATVWMFVGAPLALLPHQPLSGRGVLNRHNPVLLIPGYGLTRVMMWPLAVYLRHQGRWVWCINNPIYEDDIPTFATNAKRAVAHLKACSGAEQVDIVGHSMGGIIGAWFIAHLDGAKDVRRLVTLGTPWAGTKMAIFGFGRQSLSLRPTSSTLTSLDDFAHDTVALWSPADCIVQPSSSAAPSHASTVELTDVGHLEMVLNPTAWQAIRDALEAAPS